MLVAWRVPTSSSNCLNPTNLAYNKSPYPSSVSVAPWLISRLPAPPRGVHRLRDALSEPEVNITENEVGKGSGGM